MYSGSSILQEPAIEEVRYAESYQRFSLKKLSTKRMRDIRALRNARQSIHATMLNREKRACKKRRIILSRCSKQRSKIKGVIAFGKLEDRRSFVQRLAAKKVQNIKPSARVVLNRMLKVRIAHGMDPIQRAGQTKSSNEKDAIRYGRSPRKKKSVFMSLFKILIRLLLLMMFPVFFCKNFIVKGAINSLKSRYKPKKRQKRQSFAIKVFRPSCVVAFAR